AAHPDALAPVPGQVPAPGRRRGRVRAPRVHPRRPLGARVSEVLYRMSSGSDLVHWCEGCQTKHVLPWERGGWTWNGSLTSPTFTPSFRHAWKEWSPEGPVEKVCHYVITSGEISYCADSWHALRGLVRVMIQRPPDLAGPRE